MRFDLATKYRSHLVGHTSVKGQSSQPAFLSRFIVLLGSIVHWTIMCKNLQIKSERSTSFIKMVAQKVDYFEIFCLQYIKYNWAPFPIAENEGPALYFNVILVFNRVLLAAHSQALSCMLYLLCFYWMKQSLITHHFQWQLNSIEIFCALKL